jgi:hypothetical protein
MLVDSGQKPTMLMSALLDIDKFGDTHLSVLHAHATGPRDDLSPEAKKERLTYVIKEAAAVTSSSNPSFNNPTAKGSSWRDYAAALVSGAEEAAKATQGKWPEKWAGHTAIAGRAFSVLGHANNLFNIAKSPTPHTIAKTAGGIGGAWAGAKAGAAAGVYGGPLGVGVGAFLGGAAGAFLGGEALGAIIPKDTVEKTKDLIKTIDKQRKIEYKDTPPGARQHGTEQDLRRALGREAERDFLFEFRQELSSRLEKLEGLHGKIQELENTNRFYVQEDEKLSAMLGKIVDNAQEKFQNEIKENEAALASFRSDAEKIERELAPLFK